MPSIRIVRVIVIITAFIVHDYTRDIPAYRFEALI